jgi:hypothetical protein
MTMDHTQHDASHGDHEHGEGCGHASFQHEGHTDYVHDGHSHARHDEHWDEHATQSQAASSETMGGGMQSEPPASG